MLYPYRNIYIYIYIHIDCTHDFRFSAPPWDSFLECECLLPNSRCLYVGNDEWFQMLTSTLSATVTSATDILDRGEKNLQEWEVTVPLTPIDVILASQLPHADRDPLPAEQDVPLLHPLARRGADALHDVPHNEADEGEDGDEDEEDQEGEEVAEGHSRSFPFSFFPLGFLIFLQERYRWCS